MKRVKLKVGQNIWLVPSQIFNSAFNRAMNKFNLAKDGDEIDWTDDEEKAFLYVFSHFDVWKPL